jgi:starch-binding outer membrane protein, SusD/RagB family
MKLSNKRSHFIILLLLLIYGGSISCKKYLDIKPDSKLAVPASPDDLQAILDYTNVMNLQTTPSLGESSADDYFLLGSTYGSFVEGFRNVYTWRVKEYNYFPNDWSNAYSPVFNANFCLDQVEKLAATGNSKLKWENIKGSALFYRSYYFMHLLWAFSKAYDPASFNKDLGIVLRLGSDFNVPSKRASVKECYDRVIQDAKLAATYLPEYPLHVMRPSKGAAYGLLAKAYLSMRVYDSAYKYGDLCLKINNELIDYNGDPDINGSIGADIPFKRFNKETIFYSEMTANSFIISPGWAKTDTLLYSMYDSNDLRKTAFFIPVSGYYSFKNIYTGGNYYYFSGIATDEIYLIKAECLAREGNTAAAMDALNSLLIKRWKAGTFIPLSASNASEALNIILKERRKELLMRGVRWMDIKRLNKEGANIKLVRKIGGQVYTLEPNANYYALPLPADIIKASGIPQNE